MAWDWSNAPSPSLAEALHLRVEPVTPRRAIRDGFLVGALNPKSIVFFAAILPQFGDPAASSIQVQMLALGVVFVAIALVSDSCWGLAASTARSWFEGSPGRSELIGAGGGLAMLGLAANLAV